MPTLLSIEVSPRGEKSITRAFGDRFVEHWKQNHPDGKVIHRDLMKPTIPYMNTDWIMGVFAPPEVMRTPEMNAALALSSELIAELQEADHLLISTPMYNFAVPAVLKSWLDYVVRPELTYQHGGGGLLTNKVAKILVISRDTYTPDGTPGETADHVSPMLRQVLAYIGITDVEVVLVGGSLSVNRGLVKLEDHMAVFEHAIARSARG